MLVVNKNRSVKAYAAMTLQLILQYDLPLEMIMVPIEVFAIQVEG